MKNLANQYRNYDSNFESKKSGKPNQNQKPDSVKTFKDRKRYEK